MVFERSDRMRWARTTRGMAVVLVGAAVLAAAVVSLVSASLAGTAATPAGGHPARAAAEALLGLVADDGDADVRILGALLAPNFLDEAPLEHHVRLLRSIRERTGGLDPVSVRRDEALAAELVVRTRRTEELLLLTVTVESDPPHRVTAVTLSPVQEDAAAPAGGEGPAPDVLASVSAYLDRLAEREVFSGTVLIARGAEVLLAESRGRACRRHGVPTGRDTRYNVGSVSKMFTSAAVAQLVARGRLALDDPAARHLPGVTGPEGFDRITIAHLLGHRSGLGDYLARPAGRPYAIDAHADSLLAEALAAPLEFPPGEQRRYSNTGYLVLGAVIEAISGRSYAQYVRENVFEPAGMGASGFPWLDSDEPDLAAGYVEWDSDAGPVRRDYARRHPPRGGAAGGGVTTVDDLHRFFMALFGGELVAAGVLREWLDPADGEAALGFAVERGGEIVGHTGGFPGLSASAEVHLPSGTVAIVLANTSDGAQPVARRIRELFYPEPSGSSSRSR